MPGRRKVAVVAAIVTASMCYAGYALAGPPLADLPAPGVVGLVAGGVIAAIAVARWRGK